MLVRSMREKALSRRTMHTSLREKARSDVAVAPCIQIPLDSFSTYCWQLALEIYKKNSNAIKTSKENTNKRIDNDIHIGLPIRQTLKRTEQKVTRFAAPRQHMQKRDHVFLTKDCLIEFLLLLLERSGHSVPPIHPGLTGDSRFHATELS